MAARRLLVIDDDGDFADGLTIALGLEGYEVDVASNGRDGIEAAKGAAYEAVLIDIGLPDLDGVQILRQVKQINPKARCVLLTGYSTDSLLEQGIDAGALKILTKPVDVDELLELLPPQPSSR